MTPPKDPCPKVRRRIAHDLKQGNTTSQATIDFIRRTCRCEACVKAPFIK